MVTAKITLSRGAMLAMGNALNCEACFFDSLATDARFQDKKHLLDLFNQKATENRRLSRELVLAFDDNDKDVVGQIATDFEISEAEQVLG